MVSSISDPDTLIISHEPWTTTEQSQWQLRDKKVGAKKIKIVMEDGGDSSILYTVYIDHLVIIAIIMTGSLGATKEQEVRPEEAKNFCMSDHLAMQLAHVVFRLEKLYNHSPRDIEFATRGSRVYLLQVQDFE